jgi:hypothetical protein
VIDRCDDQRREDHVEPVFQHVVVRRRDGTGSGDPRNGGATEQGEDRGRDQQVRARLAVEERADGEPQQHRRPGPGEGNDPEKHGPPDPGVSGVQ